MTTNLYIKFRYGSTAPHYFRGSTLNEETWRAQDIEKKRREKRERIDFSWWGGNVREKRRQRRSAMCDCVCVTPMTLFSSHRVTFNVFCCARALTSSALHTRHSLLVSVGCITFLVFSATDFLIFFFCEMKRNLFFFMKEMKRNLNVCVLWWIWIISPKHTHHRAPRNSCVIEFGTKWATHYATLLLLFIILLYIIIMHHQIFVKKKCTIKSRVAFFIWTNYDLLFMVKN